MFMSNTTALQKKAVKKALVVEDEGEMGLLLNLFLDEKDFELDYVQDLVHAEEYLENEQPAVVILDNRLPDGFGVDFIGFIKKKYPAIKIIMISGFPSAGDIAMENGADAFLEKPFTRGHLYETINRLML
ncbi:MAG: response regulator [Bacteroidetes bacterium]|jgi:two-component system OmpR family response regulator|nr:MAG: response regulator [Bacteroidota bacterium]